MENMINTVLEFIRQYGGLGWVIAALALSFSIFQFLYKRQSNKVTPEVSFSNGLLTYPNGSLSDMMIFLKIANTGNKKIVLSSVTLDIKSKPGSSIIDGYGNLHALPYVLEPGCDYQVWYEAVPIAKSLKSSGQSGKVAIYGDFNTQAHGKFRSKKPYRLDVDGWAK